MNVDPDTDTVVSGAVKMLGLHATVVSRRQQHQDPVIEDYRFVPYEEDLFQDITESLLTYSKHCCSYAAEGLQNLPTNGNSHNSLNNIRKVLQNVEQSVCDQEIDDYVQQKDCGLITMLSKIFTTPHDVDFSQNVKNTISSSKASLRNDRLFSYLLEPQVLKPCLDIVLENLSTPKINILEIESSYSSMYNHAIKLLNSQPMLLVNYTAADLSDRLDNELSSVGVNTLQWDISQAPPTSLKPVDLTIANNALHRQKDLSVALSNISRSMTEGAFFLIKEITKNFHVYLPIEALANELPEICDKDQRTCAVYCDENKWLDHFSSADFEVISKKSDGMLSTLFLLRKVKDCSPCKQTIMSLNSMDCGWVEELKDNLKDCQNKGSPNLWLVVDNQHNSGIVGMINCLKQESGGEKLR